MDDQDLATTVYQPPIHVLCKVGTTTMVNARHIRAYPLLHPLRLPS